MSDLGGATGIEWGEDKDIAKHAKMNSTAPQQKMMAPKMSMVPVLRNPAARQKAQEKSQLSMATV